MAVTEKQYSRSNVRLFEMAFGEGFMSCGGQPILAYSSRMRKSDRARTYWMSVAV